MEKLFTRNKNLLSLLAGCALAAGCGQSSDQAASTADQNNRQRTDTVTPTSRDTNSPSRVYQDTSGSDSTTDADNTGRNKRDRDDDALTPGDQGESEADRETTQRLRAALTSNDQLSTTAKNIKIITKDGKVTLRGPVNTEAERQTIAALIEQAGVTSVDNQLEVKQANQ